MKTRSCLAVFYASKTSVYSIIWKSENLGKHDIFRYFLVSKTYRRHCVSCLTLSGPAFSVVRQAQGGLRGPDAKNQS